MTQAELEQLREGDIVRNSSGLSYRVLSTAMGNIVAIRVAHVSNPPEWDLIYKAKFEEVEQ